MVGRFRKVFPLAICAIWLATPACAAQVQSSAKLLKQLHETIRKVRAGKTVDVRTDAARHLADLTRRVNPKKVDDKTVADIVSLLNIPDDSVRYWVATALGSLGPRAKIAVPKLEELLPKADCLNGAITSASAIRYALIRMGVKPPPPSKGCKPIAG